MKVALVQCPGWGRECPPFALAALAAYVRQRGHEAACFDLNNALYHQAAGYDHVWRDKDYYSFWEEPDRIAELLNAGAQAVDGCVDRILACGARVVGFSTHTTSFLVSLEVARRIKAKDPSRLVVFGGPQCSREQAARRIAADPAVDAVVVGEGEETLCELLDTVESRGGVAPMAGFLLRWNGELKDCGDRPLIADINALPIPDYSDFADDIRARRYADPKRLEIFDSRGCVRTCDFCSEWQFWRRFRTLRGERIFAEVCEQKRRFPQVDYFYFIGSLLNGSLKDLSRFCDLVIDSGLKIRWAGQAIVQPGMNQELVSKMARAGCRWLGFGIETGSERLRWSIRKKFTNDNAFETLRAAHSHGISTQINIMFGLPGETEEDFEETLRFLVRNRRHIDTVLASQSFCVLDKNTTLYNGAERLGIQGREHHLYWSADGGRNTYDERFRRYEEFCRLALQLGIPETSGVLERKPDKWRLLGEYHAHAGQHYKAIAALRRSLRLEGSSQRASALLDACYEAVGGRARRKEWTPRSTTPKPATTISA